MPKKQPKQNKKEKNTSKKYTNSRKELAKILRIDKRKLLGPKAYSDLVSGVTDILEWIEEDLKQGRFIEAYALTDQYVETLLKRVFFEVFENEIVKSSQREYLKVETVLRILSKLGKLDPNYLEEYRDFKSTRDDLVHKSIFSPEKAKEFENIPKTKSLPAKIIKDTEILFLDRFNLIYDWLSNPKIPRVKLENELKIFLAFWINARKHNTNKPLEKTMRDISKKLEEEINEAEK